jgi:mRNA interferase YafQ
MREVIFTSAFRRDYKRLAKSGQANLELLKEAVALLADDFPLDTRYRDHALAGDWAGYRECHLRPDWLLIYKLQPGRLFLARSGSHAALFG